MVPKVSPHEGNPYNMCYDIPCAEFNSTYFNNGGSKNLSARRRQSGGSIGDSINDPSGTKANVVATDARSLPLGTENFFFVLANQEHITAVIEGAFLTATDIHPHLGLIDFEVSNITSANTHKDELGKNPADINLVSESSLGPDEIKAVQSYLRETYKK